MSSSALFLCEQVALADNFVTDRLCSQQPLPHSQESAFPSTENSLPFQIINHNSADFQLLSARLGWVDSSPYYSMTARLDDNPSPNPPIPNTQKQRKQSANNNDNAGNNAVTDHIEAGNIFFELVKLYKMSASRHVQNSSDYFSAFTVVSPKSFSEFIAGKSWSVLAAGQVYSPNAGRLLYTCSFFLI